MFFQLTVYFIERSPYHVTIGLKYFHYQLRRPTFIIRNQRRMHTCKTKLHFEIFESVVICLFFKRIYFQFLQSFSSWKLDFYSLRYEMIYQEEKQPRVYEALHRNKGTKERISPKDCALTAPKYLVEHQTLQLQRKILEVQSDTAIGQSKNR